MAGFKREYNNIGANEKCYQVSGLAVGAGLPAAPDLSSLQPHRHHQQQALRGSLPSHPVGRTYAGTQPSFDYLDGREGRLIAIFYGNPNRDIINSVTMFVLDPRYEDSKMVVLEIK